MAELPVHPAAAKKSVSFAPNVQRWDGVSRTAAGPPSAKSGKNGTSVTNGEKGEKKEDMGSMGTMDNFGNFDTGGTAVRVVVNHARLGHWKSVTHRLQRHGPELEANCGALVGEGRFAKVFAFGPDPGSFVIRVSERISAGNSEAQQGGDDETEWPAVAEAVILAWHSVTFLKGLCPTAPWTPVVGTCETSTVALQERLVPWTTFITGILEDAGHNAAAEALLLTLMYICVDLVSLQRAGAFMWRDVHIGNICVQTRPEAVPLYAEAFGLSAGATTWKTPLVHAATSKPFCLPFDGWVPKMVDVGASRLALTKSFSVDAADQYIARQEALKAQVLSARSVLSNRAVPPGDGLGQRLFNIYRSKVPEWTDDDVSDFVAAVTAPDEAQGLRGMRMFQDVSSKALAGVPLSLAYDVQRLVHALDEWWRLEAGAGSGHPVLEWLYTEKFPDMTPVWSTDEADLLVDASLVSSAGTALNVLSALAGSDLAFAS